MSIAVIISWVAVAILTLGNILFFLKLKKASEQMLQMAFPGSKNMNEAMARMQMQMSQAGKAARRGGLGGFKAKGVKSTKGTRSKQKQLEDAMSMLKQMKKSK